MILSQQVPDNQINDQIRSMKLEAGWILTNLIYSSDDALKCLIFGTERAEETILLNSKRTTDLLKFKTSEQEFFTLLQILLHNEAHDLAMIDQIMYLLSNVSATNQ